MNEVLVDSSAFFALLVPRDVNHLRAVNAIQRVEMQRARLLTTNAVKFETFALLLSRAENGRAAALGFLDQLRVNDIAALRVTEQDEAAAENILRRYDDKHWSYCDALSFALCERRRIRSAISYDADFQQWGRLELL